MDVIVVGAGAAGMMAAINSAKSNNKVTVIEHKNSPGKKISITGNGKCNITNDKMNADYFYGDKKFIENVLNIFSNKDTLDFFKTIGVYCYSDKGYYYPRSNQAETVVKALVRSMSKYNIKLKTNNEIKSIKRDGDKFIVDIGIKITCDKLIVACGGKSYESTGSDGSFNKFIEELGHSIVQQKPCLVPIICADDILFKTASGVRCNVELNCENSTSKGQLQITNYGLSGICVFNLSHLIKENTEIRINFLDDISKDEFIKMAESIGNINYRDFLNGLFNEKLVKTFLKKALVNSDDLIDIKKLEIIYELITNYKIICKATRKFDMAQVTKGGVPTSEINPETMESKIVRNLYFCGEIIDVDGYCGGYNLQFAWSSGFIAGK